MKKWQLTFADGTVETVVATDLRAALIVLPPDGKPAATVGHPDDVIRAEVVDDGEEPA